LINTILLTASVITAVTGIGAFLYKMYSFFRNLEEKYDEMNATIKQNTMHLLKIAIMSEELPLIDRIKAGEIYVASGGNGLIKKKYNELISEYEEREKSHKL
jgi:hypothetical protein